MLKLLIVEDERMIADFIGCGLAEANFEYDCAYDGLSAADMIDQNRYDLILLDVMLLGVDGFELMRYIAPLGIPVIFLTAKAGVDDRVAGLRLGADDYIVKPFDMLTLMVRIEKVLKRTGRLNTVYRVQDIEVNSETRAVTKCGKAIELQPLEFDVLLMLLKNKNLTVSREQLLSEIWGYDYIGETRVVDVKISSLRKKLDLGSEIKAIPKLGYRLEER